MMDKDFKTDKSPEQVLLAFNDALNVINGKWKIRIVCTLMFGKKRFTEMEGIIPNITPRMLSKELKELEANGIVKRSVYNTIPVTVEYELTPSGETLKQVVDVMIEWGGSIGKIRRVIQIFGSLNQGGRSTNYELIID